MNDKKYQELMEELALKKAELLDKKNATYKPYAQAEAEYGAICERIRREREKNSIRNEVRKEILEALNQKD